MLPLMKVVMVGFKIVSRPLNNVLKRVFTHWFMFMHRFITYFGQKAHFFEVYLNRRVVNNETNLEFYVKPLSDEAAFNKGVDYFVEIMFFYGILMAIAVYEVKKSAESSEKQKRELQRLIDTSKDNE